jgi:hypothetical protein
VQRHVELTAALLASSTCTQGGAVLRCFMVVQRRAGALRGCVAPATVSHVAELLSWSGHVDVGRQRSVRNGSIPGSGETWGHAWNCSATCSQQRWLPLGAACWECGVRWMAWIPGLCADAPGVGTGPLSRCVVGACLHMGLLSSHLSLLLTGRGSYRACVLVVGDAVGTCLWCCGSCLLHYTRGSM